MDDWLEQKTKSVEFVRSVEVIPVPVAKRGKDTKKYWDSRNPNKINPETVFNDFLESPDENMGALFFNNVVDVDIDNEDRWLTECLDYFLPNCQFIWGRASKPKSHRTYVLKEAYVPEQHSMLRALLKRNKDYALEIRGGAINQNQYCVVPGSIHPSGEMYRWDPSARIDPTTSPAIVSFNALSSAIRMSIASAMLCPYFQQAEGARNDLSMALTGYMWRLRKFSLNDAEEEDYDGFLLNYELAKKLIFSLLDLADPNPSDRRQRVLNFENTWRKLNQDEDARITGGTRVREILFGDDAQKQEANDFMRFLSRVLSDSPSIIELEEAVERFYIWHGPGLLIDMDMVRKNLDRPFMTREAAKNSMAHKWVTVGGDRKPLVDWIYSTALSTRVVGFTFDPSDERTLIEDGMGQWVNEWTGFALEPTPDAVEQKDVQPFLDYLLEVVADKDFKVYEWVLAWVADMFQNPSDKIGTALVLVGPQGVGKSFLGEKIIRRLIGKAHSTAFNSLEDITDRFNKALNNLIFVQCDEATHGWNKAAANRLKSMITDDVQYIEYKGIDKFRKPNHMRFMMTSNASLEAVYVDPDPGERRYTFLKVGEKRRGDIAYYSKLDDWCQQNLAVLMKFFMTYKYDRGLIRKPHNTDMKREAQIAALDPEIRWLIKRLLEGHILGEDTHKHWFYAFDRNKEQNESASKFNSQEIDRESWPTHVIMGAIEDDLAREMRTGFRKGASAQTIASIIRTPAPPWMKNVKYYDRKNDSMVSKRVRLYEIKSKKEIMESLERMYGGILESVKNELAYHEQHEQTLSEAKGQKVVTINRGRADAIEKEI